VSNFIIPYLYEAQHISGNTPPINAVPHDVHQLHIQTTFHGIMKNQRLPVQF